MNTVTPPKGAYDRLLITRQFEEADRLLREIVRCAGEAGFLPTGGFVDRLRRELQVARSEFDAEAGHAR